jgi:PAS domain S-box-containing protein
MAEGEEMPIGKLVHEAEDFLQLADLTSDILEVIPSGVVAIDPGGVIRYANRTICIRSGYHKSELIGEAVELLVPESSREIHRTKHRPTYALFPQDRPMTPDSPLKLRQRSGAEVPVAIQLAPKPHRGGMLTVAVIRFLDA